MPGMETELWMVDVDGNDVVIGIGCGEPYCGGVRMGVDCGAEHGNG